MNSRYVIWGLFGAATATLGAYLMSDDELSSKVSKSFDKVFGK